MERSSRLDDEILILTGDAAKEFLEYDSRELTAEEIQSNKEALEYYKSHCKKQEG